MDIDNLSIDDETKKIILSLLAKSENKPPMVEDIWKIVDSVWDEIGCDNKNLDQKKMREFYHHPIWILNGLFIEQHDLSMQHREAIAEWIVEKNFKRVLDFGGGFGTLSRLIAEKDSTIQADIYEPYPNKYAVSTAAYYSNVSFVNLLENNYDCLISYTTLEHVPDPLKLFSEMIRSVNKDGYLIVANDFYPVVKCHLPSTFHLRYSFNKFAKLMGLELIGFCEGSPATIFRKKEAVPCNWRKIRFYESVSRALFPFLKIAHFIYQRIKRFFRGG